MTEDESPSVWSGSTASASVSSSDRSCNSSTQDWPLNKDKDDTLIPSPSDVDHTFCDGKATWKAFLAQANRIPSGLWPADILDLYMTLVDVPSMPEQLPRRDELYGRPCWEVPLDLGGTSCKGHDPHGGVARVHGRRVMFRLRIQGPTVKRVYSQDDVFSG
ncbi:hypothetical protein F66182_10330 [Fusarium sp. NRRL 66182]|nr:hypothetical protein F66182_10330 [Fusarium sp. NRRL 66182]